MSYSRRIWALVAALTVCVGVARPAAAAVDVNGTWRFDAFVGPTPFATFFGTLVQTGTVLEAHIDPEPDLVRSGPIDVVTGAFDLSGGPYTADGAPPGPEAIFAGTAAADGNTLTAVMNACIFEIDVGWGCITLNLQGARIAPETCGDGVLQEPEECDLGAENGGSCCSSMCVLVDADGDDVCDASDNCPFFPNLNQSDLDGDGTGDVCDRSPLTLELVKIAARRDGSARTLVLRGVYDAIVAAPIRIGIEAAGPLLLDTQLLPAWAAKQCVTTANRSRCVSPDRSLKVVVSRTGSGGVRLRFKMKHPPITAPFAGPVSVTVAEPSGIHEGIIATCVTKTSGSLRCR